MKGIKKLLTGILAATMIMGASVTAFASENASITITNENNNTGEVKEITYTYYQILKADIKNVSNSGENNADQEGTAAYYVESQALADLLKATNLFNVAESKLDTRWNITAKEGITGSQVAEALNTDAFKTAASATGTFSNANGVASTAVEPGYYLILSSLGTAAVVQTLGDVTINEKNTYPTITKKDDRDVDCMFDEIKPIVYTIEVAVPASVAEKDITVYDVATKGLTLYPTATAKVGEDVLGTYTWGEGVANEDGSKFTYALTIPAATVIANKGKTITLTYNAVINEKAVVLVPEKNTAYLEYDNYKSAETDEVTVLTLGFNILKVDGADSSVLTGAEFSLWDAKEGGNQIHVVYDNDAKAYRVASSEEIAAMTVDGKVNSAAIAVDENGAAQIIGLTNEQTYYLQEDVAPTGYNKLTEREQVVISSTTALETVTVKNNSGSVLPSTGGIGTTIFYILGGVLIIAGVAYFMVRRKADAE
ncbi:MAG: isopeptide-forming domain-containing fimbrial protein [Butyrivibrio sp.]|jgi:fimbrial isopeptide formation D2 family protein/LPXTG-motif cell wall-anchored protein|nr:isopeptide-forming domain-containing fimbrial protein [Butyrivibrio sp.]